MIFKVKSERDANIVITAAQITHIVFVVLAVIFIVHGFVTYRTYSPVERVYFHALIVGVIGLGCLINAEAVIALSSLDKSSQQS